MIKLFKKDKLWFALLCIVIYVVGFSLADGLSESIEIPKLVTVLFGLVLSLLALGFMRKNELYDYIGLKAFNGSKKDFLWFIPLILISSVNLWNGLTLNETILVSVLSVVSMCFVGFLEEVIFRGFLFRGMCESSIKKAIIISSLTFGMGHIVNLLLGAPVFDTLLQLIYASAIGFCYTAIAYRCGSIIPCILSHIAVNSLSIFATEPTMQMSIIIALLQTVISISYGLWILRGKCADEN